MKKVTFTLWFDRSATVEKEYSDEEYEKLGLEGLKREYDRLSEELIDEALEKTYYEVTADIEDENNKNIDYYCLERGF